jgi:NAD(P)-dependent dehydrogenase (short-subunit alcohol dehydrogenase family)
MKSNVAIITGASQDISRSTALRLAGQPKAFWHDAPGSTHSSELAK